MQRIDKERKIIILTALTIFIITLLPGLYLAVSSREIPANDAAGYDSRGMSILEGRGFLDEDGKITAMYEPFYSFFLSGVYYLFGHSYTAVRIIQAILIAITCVIAFFMARIFFGWAAAITSALAIGFNPAMIKSSEAIMTESIFALILIIGIFILIKHIKKPRVSNLVLLGIILGLAALTRAAIFFFPVFIIAAFGKKLAPAGYNARKYILAIIVFILSFILPIFPWALRNWNLFHKIVPISTKTGLVLYSSYAPKEGKLYGFTANDQTMLKARQLPSEAQQSEFLVKETLKLIKSNPLRVLKLETLKTAYFWSPFDWEVIGKGTYNFMYGFILPFFIYGILITRARFKELWPLYLPVAYSFLIALLTFASPRHRLALEPYMIIIASAGIIHFICRFHKRIKGILFSGVYFCLNLFFYFNSYQVKLLTRSFFEKIHLW